MYEDMIIHQRKDNNGGMTLSNFYEVQYKFSLDEYTPDVSFRGLFNETNLDIKGYGMSEKEAREMYLKNLGTLRNCINQVYNSVVLVQEGIKQKEENKDGN